MEREARRASSTRATRMPALQRRLAPSSWRAVKCWRVARFGCAIGYTMADAKCRTPVVASTARSLPRESPKRAALLNLNGEYSGSWLAIKGAQLVAIGIAKISEICLAGGSPAHTRRVLDRGTAIRDAGFVPCVGLCRASHCEADRAAMGMSSRRLGIDGETPAIVRVK